MSLLLAVLLILDDAPSVGEKVAQYARSHLGEKVGDGECSALPNLAYRHAGAKPPTLNDEGEVIWGETVASLKDVKPGDVLQFEEAVFVRRERLPGGGVRTLTFKYPHHAAVVVRARPKGKTVAVTVIHQNVGFVDRPDEDRKVTQEWTFDPAEKRGGTLKAYRPLAGEVVESP